MILHRRGRPVHSSPVRAPFACPTQRRFLSTRVILLLLGFFGATLAAPAATVVRVLDYNIHRDIGGPDSERDAQPALAKIVNYLNPDVWTINELGGNSSFSATFARADLISFVRSELTIFGADPTEGTDFFVYVGAINDGFITNAIVSRFPFLMTRTYSDAGGGFAALRGLAMALVDLPGANDLGVFTAHLKAFNATADAERRQAEAEVNSATIRGWLEGNPSAAAVLAGDFNETEDAGQGANWSGHMIGDPLPSDGRPYQPITTFKAAGLSDARPVSVRGDKDTISASNPTRRFDYILFTPDLLALQGGVIFDTRQYTTGELNAINRDHGASFVSTDSAIASDHLPVFAEFQIVPEPSTIALLLIALLCLIEMRSFRRIEILPSSDALPRVRAARETHSTWMKVFALSFFATLSVLCGRDVLADADIVIADFEGADYGGWSVVGSAFGKAPARGTLPNQQKVDGFLGRGLVNTFHGGDGSTGELKSPPFEIRRDYIAFLIGGGGFAEETCMQLLVDGRVVRSATGPNTVSGGSETLNREVWDVREFRGRSGQIQIIDRAVGGWGHINVDDIFLTDRRPVGILAHARRDIVCDARYLNLPVKWKGAKRRVALHVDERVAREFEIILADDEPDFWVFLDLAPFHGKRALLTVDRLPENSQALSSIEISGKIRNAETLYREKLRPQFHFSSRRGWLNDPNGLVYEAGRYHLFYQHNPYGWEWGNMHWGHATSRDLVHWEELPIALYPRRFGDWVFSGSAVMDKANTSGWKSGATDVMVAAFTSTGRGECMVYSTDDGESWVEHSANPVIKHVGRDPRILWHRPTNRWVMALYSEQENKRWITFHSSPDLKTWQFESRIEGFYECPDLFELPVDGDPRNTRWVLTAANSEYLIGTFDGRRFQPETGKLPGHRGEHFYAAQTYMNMPDDRCVQIGWAQIAMPAMPFNQMMWFPCELRLRTTADGLRLCWQPAREVEKLRKVTTPIAAGPLAPGTNPLGKVTGELFEMRGELAADAAHQLGIRIGDLAIVYDVARKELKAGKQRIPLKLSRGNLDWVILIDRMSVELFVDGGAVYIPLALPPGERAPHLDLFAEGGSAQIVRWDVHELRSIWGN